MTTEEQEMFYFDVRKINWQSYLENYILGIRQFTLKDDPTTLPTARTNLKRWLKWIVPQPPGDASVFVRTINLPFVSETLTESHAESNLAYNFTWPNNVTTWVETAVQCRPLLAVPIRLSAARLISCKNTSELVLLVSTSSQFSGWRRRSLCSTIAEIVNTTKSELLGCSSTWFCCSQLVKDVIESS
ncbi:hypothetical protein DAPPUDRAFT_110093 [Daphnia pulex]|uniref:Fatty acyl-CoA reductase C-terminal domain-containing protein n=1 Tax=Daphnia pulex TaxID=6669 RepID=E9H570_DAPPU|nr:hypothetical protein DAPPUDRAFT_110093 [Daphnia pulex]|eukprot:EFX73129.1 hypothetical protein DAPPUDRAFT_110093 [Daphnia pulex]